MSIYADLLNVALDQALPPDGARTTYDALTRLVACRRRLDVDASPHTSMNWAPDAIADQLAYDIALIELARHLGIDVDLGGFDHSHAERTRLEHVLESKGLRLELPDDSDEMEIRTESNQGR